MAALCFAGITSLFVGIGHDWWGWLAKLQFLPLLSRVIAGATLGNAALLLGILLITWVFGRIYCSVLCPLGVFQDIVLRLRRILGKWIKPLRKQFKWNKERTWARSLVAGITVAAFVVDLQLIIALIGPYSAYGRMVTAVVGGGSVPLLIAAGATFVIIGVSAWLWGRAWCSNVCPVGTALGCVSRFSLFGVKIDDDKCIRCGACTRVCKASCIEPGVRGGAAVKIDRSRCVDCFDCIGVCRKNAISFGTGVSKGGDLSSPASAADEGRRQFLATGALLIGAGVSAAAQNMKVDGGLAPVDAKTPVERNPRLVPPGAGSVKNFYDACTACQLCIQNCPNGVLRASTDLDHLLQPQMGYENGFCRPECTICSELCPAGAIRPVAKEAKTLIHIGIAEVNTDLCLAAKGEAGCGKCARECPMGAVSMVTADGTRRPVVMEELCIGCGKCEYLCPSRPVSAITVRGLQTHRS